MLKGMLIREGITVADISHIFCLTLKKACHQAFRDDLELVANSFI